MSTKLIVTMTPEQLLAKFDYAVVRYLDGEMAWIRDTCRTLESAKQTCADYRAATKGDYRVVRIKHES